MHTQGEEGRLSKCGRPICIQPLRRGLIDERITSDSDFNVKQCAAGEPIIAELMVDLPFPG